MSVYCHTGWSGNYHIPTQLRNKNNNVYYHLIYLYIYTVKDKTVRLKVYLRIFIVTTKFPLTYTLKRSPQVQGKVKVRVVDTCSYRESSVRTVVLYNSLENTKRLDYPLFTRESHIFVSLRGSHSNSLKVQMLDVNKFCTKITKNIGWYTFLVLNKL